MSTPAERTARRFSGFERSAVSHLRPSRAARAPRLTGRWPRAATPGAIVLLRLTGLGAPLRGLPGGRRLHRRDGRLAARAHDSGRLSRGGPATAAVGLPGTVSSWGTVLAARPFVVVASSTTTSWPRIFFSALERGPFGSGFCECRRGEQLLPRPADQDNPALLRRPADDKLDRHPVYLFFLNPIRRGQLPRRLLYDADAPMVRTNINRSGRHSRKISPG